MNASTEAKVRDLRKELAYDIEQIQDNAASYRAGRNSAYQGVAIQLRNVVLGGRRALLDQLFPDATFHAFRPSNAPLELLAEFDRPEHQRARIVDLMDVRGRMSLSTDQPGMNITVEFLRRPTLTLGTWIRQWIIRPDVKVEELIREVTDHEVAHTQTVFGKATRLTSNWVFSGSAKNRELRHAVIVALGDYVALRAQQLLAEEKRDA